MCAREPDAAGRRSKSGAKLGVITNIRFMALLLWLIESRLPVLRGDHVVGNAQNGLGINRVTRGKDYALRLGRAERQATIMIDFVRPSTRSLRSSEPGK